MLARTPSSAAERKRLQRARRRCGLAVLRVEAHYCRLVEALLVSTRLTEDEAMVQAQVEAAAAAILDEWTARWIGPAKFRSRVPPPR